LSLAVASSQFREVALFEGASGSCRRGLHLRKETMNDREMDELLGVVRCERCGHRLNGEIECPFCSLFPVPSRKERMPKWIFVTACFLTSPLSIYFILKDRRLTAFEKILTASGCCAWFALLLTSL
jgi:hypothetical protein